MKLKFSFHLYRPRREGHIFWLHFFLNWIFDYLVWNSSFCFKSGETVLKLDMSAEHSFHAPINLWLLNVLIHLMLKNKQKLLFLFLENEILLISIVVISVFSNTFFIFLYNFFFLNVCRNTGLLFFTQKSFLKSFSVITVPQNSEF